MAKKINYPDHINYPRTRKPKITNPWAHQTGVHTNITRDGMFHAKRPGWRTSKTGRRYWESRKTRSDARGGWT
jgi:hypothetical protein